MTILSISIASQNEVHNDFHFLIDKFRDTQWSDYVFGVEGRVLSPNTDLILIRNKIASYEDIDLNPIRAALANCHIHVVVESIYGKQFAADRALNFFGYPTRKG
jgi:hypothetical protein